MDDDDAAVEALADMPLETLYAKLGEHTSVDFARWRWADVEARKANAIAWIRLKRSEFQERVCGDPNLRNHFTAGSTLNLVSAAGMVMQLIKPIAIPGTAAVVAWILVREGVNRLCSECWAASQDPAAPERQSAQGDDRRGD